jgi:YegS/Rv2252/BmrU family lipid kinase
MTRALVIGNPKAGRGRGFDELETELRNSGLEFQVASTKASGHAVEIAATAGRDGYDLVVAAGGDGTVHEVVNGLLSGGGQVPVLGVVPLGSGCDYVKTFGIPTDVAGAVSMLARDKAPISVDAGEITFRTKDGEQRRYFANIAEVGIGPEVVYRASRLPRFLGPAMYFAAFCLTLPRFKQRRATIDMDGRSHKVGLTNLVIAIGKAFGGGMLVAPKADPSDGLFDVQIQTGSKMDYVAGIPKVYKGTHIPHPRITEDRAATVTVRCEPDATIEADGEVLGTTPATFTTLPGALRLKA